MRRHAFISAALVAVIFAIYFQVRHHAFVNFDDNVYLVNILDGLGPVGIRRAFTSSILSNWIPVTWVALLVDFELYGREPAGYLLTNVALHALNAVLLYFVFLRMTGRVWRSACIAAIFAVHPLHVESVAWMSERKDVLSGAFWLLTMLAYTRYATSGRTWLQYCVALLCLALGLMAKPMLVTLPFVLLLMDYWPLGRLQADESALPDAGRLRSAIVEKIPFFALAAVASVVALITQRSSGSVSDFELVPLTVRIANAFESYVAYVWTSVWPVGLSPLYPHALEIETPAYATACAVGLAAATGFLLWNTKRWPWAAVGWLWFLGTLVPVIGLVQVGGQARADRYMYLPQIGLSLIVVWGTAEICERRHGLRVWISAAAGTALVALAVTAWAQTTHWRDTIHLWQRVLVIDDGYFRAQRGLADALRKKERFDEAAAAYAAALRLRPDDARVHFGIAESLVAQKQFAASLSHFERALELDPDRPRSRINFAHMLLNSGRVPEARQQFEQVERDLASGRAALTRPFRFSLHSGLATAKQRQGDLDGAIDQLRKATQVRPNSVEANTRLGILALETGRDELARVHLERAVRNGGSAPALLDAVAELRRRGATP